RMRDTGRRDAMARMIALAAPPCPSTERDFPARWEDALGSGPDPPSPRAPLRRARSGFLPSRRSAGAGTRVAPAPARPARPRLDSEKSMNPVPLSAAISDPARTLVNRLPAGHVVRTMLFEHDRLLGFLERLDDLIEHLRDAV